MRKLSILFMSLVAAASFTSCSGNDDPAPIPAPTTLELTVKDQLGAPVPNAVVKLFATLDDLNSGINAVATGTSDESGKVTFNEGLKTIIYFYDVTAGCQTNLYTADYRTTAALVANATTRMEVGLISSGTVAIINASPQGGDSYNLYLAIGTAAEQRLGAGPIPGGFTAGLIFPAGVDLKFRAVKVIDGTESTNPDDVVAETINLQSCGAEDAFIFPAE